MADCMFSALITPPTTYGSMATAPRPLTALAVEAARWLGVNDVEDWATPSEPVPLAGLFGFNAQPSPKVAIEVRSQKPVVIRFLDMGRRVLLRDFRLKGHIVNHLTQTTLALFLFHRYGNCLCTQRNP
jgi:hypothetical protein